MPGDERDWPTARDVLESLERTVRMAEEMAVLRPERRPRERIGEELIPALYAARTYLEVGRIKEPEVRVNLTNASLVANDLADDDPSYAPLYSALRVLREEALQAARVS
jgi:hypothetical protein